MNERRKNMIVGFCFLVMTAIYVWMVVNGWMSYNIRTMGIQAPFSEFMGFGLRVFGLLFCLSISIMFLMWSTED